MKPPQFNIRKAKIPGGAVVMLVGKSISMTGTVHFSSTDEADEAYALLSAGGSTMVAATRLSTGQYFPPGKRPQND